jgi:integral membrane protein
MRNRKIVSAIAIAEGCSYLAFAITMPLKYQLDIFWPNKIVGWLHGFLFVAYLFAMFYAYFQFKWSLKVLFLGLISSLIPFAPFLFDKRYLNNTSYGKRIS